MRRILISFVIVLSTVTMSVSPVLADPSMTFILQAFANEERAPKKYGELTLKRSDTETHYIIARILPDKLYMHLSENDREQEFYVIGDRMYQQNELGWVSIPAAPQLSTPFSIVSLFENRLENITEQDPVLIDGVEQRVFVGTISWFAGRSRNEGEIEIHIETQLILPRLMRFKGICGTNECAFEYAITYDPSISIEAPIP